MSSRRKVRMPAHKPKQRNPLTVDQHRADILVLVHRLGYNQAYKEFQSDWNLSDAQIEASNKRLKPLGY